MHSTWISRLPSTWQLVFLHIFCDPMIAFTYFSRSTRSRYFVRRVLHDRNILQVQGSNPGPCRTLFLWVLVSIPGHACFRPGKSVAYVIQSLCPFWTCNMQQYWSRFLKHANGDVLNLAAFKEGSELVIMLLDISEILAYLA